MSEFVTDGYVASTVLHLNAVVWTGSSLWQIVKAHRFMTQHQLTLTSPSTVTGTLQVRIIPDSADNTLEDSVDIGEELAVVAANSAILLFAGIFHGIELIETVSFDPADVLTIVLSSTRNQG